MDSPDVVAQDLSVKTGSRFVVTNVAKAFFAELFRPATINTVTRETEIEVLATLSTIAASEIITDVHAGSVLCSD